MAPYVRLPAMPALRMPQMPALRIPPMPALKMSPMPALRVPPVWPFQRGPKEKELPQPKIDEFFPPDEPQSQTAKPKEEKELSQAKIDDFFPVEEPQPHTPVKPVPSEYDLDKEFPGGWPLSPKCSLVLDPLVLSDEVLESPKVSLSPAEDATVTEDTMTTTAVVEDVTTATITQNMVAAEPKPVDSETEQSDAVVSSTDAPDTWEDETAESEADEWADAVSQPVENKTEADSWEDAQTKPVESTTDEQKPVESTTDEQKPVESSTEESEPLEAMTERSEPVQTTTELKDTGNENSEDDKPPPVPEKDDVIALILTANEMQGFIDDAKTSPPGPPIIEPKATSRFAAKAKGGRKKLGKKAKASVLAETEPEIESEPVPESVPEFKPEDRSEATKSDVDLKIKSEVETEVKPKTAVDAVQDAISEFTTNSAPEAQSVFGAEASPAAEFEAIMQSDPEAASELVPAPPPKPIPGSSVRRPDGSTSRTRILENTAHWETQLAEEAAETEQDKKTKEEEGEAAILMNLGKDTKPSSPLDSQTLPPVATTSAGWDDVSAPLSAPEETVTGADWQPTLSADPWGASSTLTKSRASSSSSGHRSPTYEEVTDDEKGSVRKASKDPSNRVVSDTGTVIVNRSESCAKRLFESPQNRTPDAAWGSNHTVEPQTDITPDFDTDPFTSPPAQASSFGSDPFTSLGVPPPPPPPQISASQCSQTTQSTPNTSNSDNSVTTETSQLSVSRGRRAARPGEPRRNISARKIEGVSLIAPETPKAQMAQPMMQRQVPFEQMGQEEIDRIFKQLKALPGVPGCVYCQKCGYGGHAPDPNIYDIRHAYYNGFGGPGQEWFQGRILSPHENCKQNPAFASHNSNEWDWGDDSSQVPNQVQNQVPKGYFRLSEAQLRSMGGPKHCSAFVTQGQDEFVKAHPLTDGNRSSSQGPQHLPDAGPSSNSGGFTGPTPQQLRSRSSSDSSSSLSSAADSTTSSTGSAADYIVYADEIVPAMHTYRIPIHPLYDEQQWADLNNFQRLWFSMRFEDAVKRAAKYRVRADAALREKIEEIFEKQPEAKDNAIPEEVRDRMKQKMFDEMREKLDREWEKQTLKQERKTGPRTVVKLPRIEHEDWFKEKLTLAEQQAYHDLRKNKKYKDYPIPKLPLPVLNVETGGFKRFFWCGSIISMISDGEPDVGPCIHKFYKGGNDRGPIYFSRDPIRNFMCAGKQYWPNYIPGHYGNPNAPKIAAPSSDGQSGTFPYLVKNAASFLIVPIVVYYDDWLWHHQYDPEIHPAFTKERWVRQMKTWFARPDMMHEWFEWRQMCSMFKKGMFGKGAKLPFTLEKGPSKELRKWVRKNQPKLFFKGKWIPCPPELRFEIIRYRDIERKDDRRPKPIWALDWSTIEDSESDDSDSDSSCCNCADGGHPECLEGGNSESSSSESDSSESSSSEDEEYISRDASTDRVEPCDHEQSHIYMTPNGLVKCTHRCSGNHDRAARFRRERREKRRERRRLASLKPTSTSQNEKTSSSSKSKGKEESARESESESESDRKNSSQYKSSKNRRSSPHPAAMSRTKQTPSSSQTKSKRKEESESENESESDRKSSSRYKSSKHRRSSPHPAAISRTDKHSSSTESKRKEESSEGESGSGSESDRKSSSRYKSSKTRRSSPHPAAISRTKTSSSSTSKSKGKRKEESSESESESTSETESESESDRKSSSKYRSSKSRRSSPYPTSRRSQTETKTSSSSTSKSKGKRKEESSESESYSESDSESTTDSDETDARSDDSTRVTFKVDKIRKSN